MARRIVVSYDIRCTTREGRGRLRRVARACEDFGCRVQKSVFECLLEEKDLERLRARLLNCIVPEEDSLRLYFLADEGRRQVEQYGRSSIVDFTEPLVV